VPRCKDVDDFLPGELSAAGQGESGSGSPERGRGGSPAMAAGHARTGILYRNGKAATSPLWTVTLR